MMVISFSIHSYLSHQLDVNRYLIFVLLLNIGTNLQFDALFPFYLLHLLGQQFRPQLSLIYVALILTLQPSTIKKVKTIPNQSEMLKYLLLLFFSLYIFVPREIQF